MTPYEIMLSESQERMLLVVERGREHEVEAVFEKWDLHAVKVGEVTEGTRLKIHERGTLVADVPNRALTDEAPVYHRPMEVPLWQKSVQEISFADLAPAPSAQQAFDRLIAVPTIASKRWAYRQYDHTVGTNTIAQPGMSAAVVRVKDTSRGLAISVDGNGRFCYLDPYQGADPRRCRGVAQRRVRRRRADRRDQQSQLRQSRAAGDHVADRRSRPRHRRRVPRAPRADHRRQRQPL